MHRTYEEVNLHALPSTYHRAGAGSLSGGVELLVSVSLRCVRLLCGRRSMQAKHFIEQEDNTRYKVNLGFVPNMRVPGFFYVNDRLKSLIFEELQHACQRGGHGGFLPAVQQLANVAGLPGIVKVKHVKSAASMLHSDIQLRKYPDHQDTSVLQKSIALPDVHSGYGFAIGNVAAFDMADPEAIVSPGGVGFDINCGVRLIRTNLVSTPTFSPIDNI